MSADPPTARPAARIGHRRDQLLQGRPPRRRRTRPQPAPRRPFRSTWAPAPPPRERPVQEGLARGLLGLPVAVVVVDRRYDIQLLNNAARRLLGLHGVAIGEDLIHQLRGVPAVELRAAIDAAFQPGAPRSEEASTVGTRAANQELATANMDLRSALEEALVRVEETQASAEEVEVLNEELQASNEELETVNEELQATIEELNATYADRRARGAKRDA